MGGKLLEEVINLFKQIQQTSSLNDKKAIITANKDNKLFKKCLKFLLDGNIVTGISDKKLKKFVGMSGFEMNTFEEIMKYLIDNNSGSDIDIGTVQFFIENEPEEYKEFYEQMVTKKFRLGADAKLVNKCIPGLIPTFDVMLGTSIEKCKIPEGTWFSLSHKLNGNRCISYKGELYTRQGKKYTGLDHIKNQLAKLCLDSLVYDGELIYKNPEGLTDSEAFQKGTGIAQSKNESKEELKLVIFDIITDEDFENGISVDTYKQRRESLLKLKEIISEMNTDDIEIVNMFYEGTDQSEIWKWLDYAEHHDMEGLMLSLDAPYECKRTKNLIKVKKFYDFDLKIIGYEEGTGRNKGRLGAFVVDYKGNHVKVGSGFSDEERDKFWENREELIGRVITVKYKEISKDKKTGLESLQFPIYCRLREIGKEPSYN